MLQYLYLCIIKLIRLSSPSRPGARGGLNRAARNLTLPLGLSFQRKTKKKKSDNLSVFLFTRHNLYRRLGDALDLHLRPLRVRCVCVCVSLCRHHLDRSVDPRCCFRGQHAANREICFVCLLKPAEWSRSHPTAAAAGWRGRRGVKSAWHRTNRETEWHERVGSRANICRLVGRFFLLHCQDIFFFVLFLEFLA